MEIVCRKQPAYYYMFFEVFSLNAAFRMKYRINLKDKYYQTIKLEMSEYFNLFIPKHFPLFKVLHQFIPEVNGISFFQFKLDFFLVSF